MWGHNQIGQVSLKEEEKTQGYACTQKSPCENKTRRWSRRDDLGETKPTGILVLDFQPPELQEH